MALYRLHIAIYGLLQSIIILSLIHTHTYLPPVYKFPVTLIERMFAITSIPQLKQKFHTDNINIPKSTKIHIVSHSSNHPSHLHSPNTIPLPQNKNPTIFITKLQQNPSKNTPTPLTYTIPLTHHSITIFSPKFPCKL